MLNWNTTKSQIVYDGIRHTLALIIRQNTPPPKPSLKSISASYSDRRIHFMAPDALHISEGFLELQDVQSFMSSNDYTEDDIRNFFNAFYNSKHHIEDYREVSMHADHLEKIVELLDDTNTSFQTYIDHTEFVRRHCMIMQDYANTVSIWIDNASDEDLASKQFFPNIEQWVPSLYYEYRRPNHSVDSTEVLRHKSVLKDLFKRLSDPAIPDKVAAYIMRQSLGNSGYVYMNSGYPFFISTFPMDYILGKRDDIWKARYGSDSFIGFEVTSPSDIQDRLHLHNDRLVASHISSSEFAKLHDEFADRLKGKHAKEQSTSDDPKSKGKGKPDHGKPDPDVPGPSGQSSSSSSTPDDSSYVPNPVLASLAQDYTKAVKSLPPDDLSHDHMTRFATSSEAPTTLSEYQKQYGKNADWTIQDSTNLGFQEFVVTFTRKSRKPIFNPVI